ncbi:MAG: ABC transporter permease [Firmicutes bacterium]|nr:ABC transporter permease [Bacillota bacterium]
MFHKDTFRLIRKTFNRFFSLVMIVLIGVAFMMGLLSTRGIMEENVDRYSDECDLQDVQLFSSYGFDDADVEEIRKLEYVDKVFPSRFADVYSSTADGDVMVARIQEVKRDVGKFELIDGRLPLGDGEVAVLDSGMTKGSYKIGERLTLFLEDSDIKDILRTDSFTIVGIVKTPDHMAKTLGTGTLKNKDLNIVLYAGNSIFLSDYYTSVFFTVKGAAQYNSFGDEYDTFMEDTLEDFKSFAKKQQEVRKESVLAEYREEIEKGEKELEEKKTEGQQQLDDAKKQLDDANIQIISAEAQIKTVETALSTLIERQRSVESQYAQRKAEYEKKTAEIEAADEAGRSFEEIFAQLSTEYATYTALRTMLDGAEGAYAEGIKRAMAELDSRYGGSIENTFTEYTAVEQDRVYCEALSREVELAAEAESRARAELRKMRWQVTEGRKQYEEGLAEYEKGLAEFNTQIEKAEIDIRKAYQQLEELPDAQWMILDRSSHYSTAMFTQNAKQMGSIGIYMPLLFFLVAALVCLTTMTRLVDEQRGQIGVFRALGFSKWKIISKYVIYALTATFIGGFIGLFVGMAIFPTVIYETWRLMYDLPQRIMSFSLTNAAICILSFAVLIAAVTIYVANKTLREVPSQLMRPKPPKNAKKVFLEKIPFLWNLLTFTGKITARNLIRYRARALMTIIGVAGCTSLLVLGWGIKDSIHDVVAIQFGQIFDYDYTISLESDEELDKIQEALGKDLSNEKAVPYMTYSSKVYLSGDEPTINVIVVDAREGSDVLKLHRTDKTTPLKIRNSGVVISEKFAKNNGLSEGDIITFESANGIKNSVKINAICEMYFQHYLYISEDQYDELFSEPLHPNAIALRNSEESAQEIEEQIKDFEGYSGLMDFSSLTDQFNTMLDALNFIILVIIITAGSLAFVVLINLTQVNISERIREIATLKVLGFHDSEVNSYIFKEIFLLSLMGSILGLPLGVVEHRFIMTVINMEMIMFGNQVKPLSFVLAFAVTIVFTVIVLFLTRRPLRKVQMIESLKSVE